MKDQFANYVVQKVLETCDDQQRELILSRIKVHLNALKKYTYGKHIVARVEKLVAAGGIASLLFALFIFSWYHCLFVHLQGLIYIIYIELGIFLIFLGAKLFMRATESWLLKTCKWWNRLPSPFTCKK